MAELDPENWYTAEQIATVRPWATAGWLRHRRENGTLRYAKTGGKTATALYRLRDVDALIGSRVVEATTGPLAPKSDSER